MLREPNPGERAPQVDTQSIIPLALGHPKLIYMAYLNYINNALAHMATEAPFI